MGTEFLKIKESEDALEIIQNFKKPHHMMGLFYYQNPTTHKEIV